MRINKDIRKELFKNDKEYRFKKTVEYLTLWTKYNKHYKDKNYIELISKVIENNRETTEKRKVLRILNRQKNIFAVYVAVKKHGISISFTKGIKVGLWATQAQCAKELNLNHQTISNCLKGNRKQHKGYIFEYVQK